MASQIIALPVEISRNIYESIEDSVPEKGVPRAVDSSAQELVPLSSTCRFLRASLAPRLFRELRFSNLSKKADSYFEAVRQYGQYVTSIHFTGAAKIIDRTGCHEDWAVVDFEVCSPQNPRCWINRPDELVSPAAREFLRGTHMPNLRSLTITWDIDWSWKRRFSWFIFPRIHVWQHVWQAEFWEDVKLREHRLGYRAMMKLVYRTVTENRVIVDLSLQPMAPKLSEVFYCPAWSAFLGRLKSLSVGITMKERELLNIGSTLGFYQFMQRINDLMYSHAKNVTQFEFTRAQIRPLGLIGLESGHFPLLVSVTLTEVCLSQWMLDFVVPRRRSIHHLYLYGCYAIMPDKPNAINWSQLFKALQQPDSALEDFICETADKQSRFVRTNNIYVYTENYVLRCDQLDEALQKNKGKRLFSYADTDTRTSAVELNPHMIMGAFQRGEDQRVYDQLMQGLSSRKSERRIARYTDM